MPDKSLLFQWGEFEIDAIKTPIKSFQRNTKYRFSEGKNINSESSISGGGKDAEVITIKGTVYSIDGGIRRIDALREKADKQEPDVLMTGYGEVLGDWVIESIDEKKENFIGEGLYRKTVYSIKFIQFNEEDGDLVTINNSKRFDVIG